MLIRLRQLATRPQGTKGFLAPRQQLRNIPYYWGVDRELPTIKIKFVTGIELDGGGTSYGKSGVNILGGNLQIDGTTIVDASRNLSNIALTTTDYYRTLANLSSTGDGGLLIYSGQAARFR